MSLKFNSFRSERYLRSRFLEGRLLLATENTDLQLEMIDKSRETIRNTIGDVSIENGWKVEKYTLTTNVTSVSGTTLFLDTTVLDLAIVGDEVLKNGSRVDSISSIDTNNNSITLPTIGTVASGDTIEIKVRNTVLISQGEAWFDGIPFLMEGGQDAAVSGSNRALGITVAIGGGSSNVTAIDEPTGRGKLLSFNSGGTTQAGTYRIVVSAKEEVVTNIEDPFLKNANIPESTAQKLRLVYRINVVPENEQDQSPIPYTDSNTDGNLVNRISVNPVSGGEGAEISRTSITGAGQIDGRDLEITIQNTIGVNKLPAGTVEQAEYTNGRFIDSYGNEYHLNLITNATVANRVTLRIDKAPGQPDPSIVPGRPYQLIKRDIFVTDDVNGNPLGQLFYPLATVSIETGSGISHESNVQDLRKSVISKQEFQEKTNIKYNLRLTDGGTIDWEVTSVGGSSDDILAWDGSFDIVNPFGPTQLIPANTVALIEGSSAVYTLDLEAGGQIAKGNKTLTSQLENAGESVIALQNNPVLEDIELGNTVRIEDFTTYITAVDDIDKTVTINTPLPSNISAGTAITVYRDVYAEGFVPLSSDSFVLATRNNNNLYFSNLELSSGETSNIGSSIPVALLNYIGSPAENDDTPDYSTPQVTTIVLPDPADISDSDYFYITAGDTTLEYYVWFDKSGSAVDPAPTGSSLEVDISAATTDEDVAEAVRAALDALGSFDATRLGATVTVTDTVDGANDLPRNANMGGSFAISAEIGSPSNVTDGTSLTQGIVDLDKSIKEIDDLLNDPIYEERVYFSSGLPALTTVNIPLNSRDDDKAQQIIPDAGAFEVFINSRFVERGVEYEIVSAAGGPVGEAQVRFLIDLPNDTTVRFRVDSLGGSTTPVTLSGGSGGSGSLQDSYINGRTITTLSGNPVIIDGPNGETIIIITENMQVDGVIL